MSGATPKDTLRSEEFDDVYFSALDGLAETQHVFIQANNLPEAWQGKERFVIAETGFGTGLNFLAAWNLFEETASAHQRLDFISFEKYPLHPAQIRDALARWDFGERLEVLLKNYPPRLEGFHKIVVNERVHLLLIFGDVNKTMQQLESPHVDCWFLDGFKPSTNPDMWSRAVFKEMARLSQSGASFATFTAAGFVKRGLQEAGFIVRKIQGFGTKRDMLAGEKL